MKKIIVIITVAILLGLEFILLPLTKVNANIIDDAQETIIEEVDDGIAYALGSIVTASQGGEVKKDENFLTKMQNLGRDTLRNAYANGKRVGDIIAVNGNQLLFNPTSLIGVIDQTWTDFANMELTWINDERATIYYGADFRLVPGEYNNVQSEIVPNYIDKPLYRIEIHGTNLDNEDIDYYNLQLRTDGSGVYSRSKNSGASRKSTRVLIHGSNYSHAIYAGFAVTYVGTEYVTISKAYAYPEGVSTTNKTHVPTGEVPSSPEIKQAYTSTFKENFDTETGQPINNNWYTYDYSSFETSTVNSSFVTNNYTEIIEEDLPPEQPEQPVYEPDGEGGGSFWGALLDLISTFISTIGGLLESVINAIGNIVPSIIDFLNNALIPREGYFKDNFTEIQVKAEEKSPDFEPVTQAIGAFGTTDTPSTWEGIQVNIPAFGINNITIVDPIMIDRYGQQIKTWIRMILLLMTSLVLIKRVSQVMGK